MYADNMTHSAGHVAAKTNWRPGCGPTAEWVAPDMTNDHLTQIGFGETDTGRVVTTADPRDGRAVTYDTGNEDACIRYDRDLLEEIER